MSDGLPRALAERLSLKLPIDVRVVLVADGFVGSAASMELATPCVSLQHLQLMAMSGRSFRQVFESLGKFEHVPKKGTDYIDLATVHRFGEVRVRWTGFTIESLVAPLTDRLSDV